MAVNVSVQYNGGFLLDMILLTQCTISLPDNNWLCVLLYYPVFKKPYLDPEKILSSG